MQQQVVIKHTNCMNDFVVECNWRLTMIASGDDGTESAMRSIIFRTFRSTNFDRCIQFVSDSDF